MKPNTINKHNTQNTMSYRSSNNPSNYDIFDDFDIINNTFEIRDTPENIKKTDCHTQIKNDVVRLCYKHNMDKIDNVNKNASGNIREVFKIIEIDTIHACYSIIKYLYDCVINNIKRFSNNPDPQYNIIFYNAARDLYVDLIYGSNYAEKTPIQLFFQRIPKSNAETVTNRYINECIEMAFIKIKQNCTDNYINQLLLNKSFAYDIVMSPFDIDDSVYKINRDIKLHISLFFSTLGNILVYMHRLFENFESDIMNIGLANAINKHIRTIKDFVHRLEKLINEIIVSYTFHSLDRDEYFGTKIIH